jgi:hypothetical protein
MKHNYKLDVQTSDSYGVMSILLRPYRQKKYMQ